MRSILIARQHSNTMVGDRAALPFVSQTHIRGVISSQFTKLEVENALGPFSLHCGQTFQSDSDIRTASDPPFITLSSRMRRDIV